MGSCDKPAERQAKKLHHLLDLWLVRLTPDHEIMRSQVRISLGGTELCAAFEDERSLGPVLRTIPNVKRVYPSPNN